MRVPVVVGRLSVTPDNSTSGSEGRLCLTFPPELADEIGGNSYNVRGNFAVDLGVLLVQAHDAPHSISPRMQMWWKNGVRDHGIREHWHVNIYIVSHKHILVTLDKPTGEPVPALPPRQITVFG
jgi:hypothetical protein